MHDKRTALARDIRAQIQKVFGGKVFKTVITKSVRLESPAYRESIFTFAPTRPARPNTASVRSSIAQTRSPEHGMRHDEHYVEALAASAGAPIGRIISGSNRLTRTRTSRARSWAICRADGIDCRKGLSSH
jgi:hypothetical protein